MSINGLTFARAEEGSEVFDHPPLNLLPTQVDILNPAPVCEVGEEAGFLGLGGPTSTLPQGMADWGGQTREVDPIYPSQSQRVG